MSLYTHDEICEGCRYATMHWNATLERFLFMECSRSLEFAVNSVAGQCDWKEPIEPENDNAA